LELFLPYHISRYYIMIIVIGDDHDRHIPLV
jgi:hypothetical protein